MDEFKMFVFVSNPALGDTRIIQVADSEMAADAQVQAEIAIPDDYEVGLLVTKSLDDAIAGYQTYLGHGFEYFEDIESALGKPFKVAAVT
jgi:hypothetical protein